MSSQHFPESRVAVISGASAGIGAATAQHLANAGFEVVIGARRKDRLEEIAHRIGSAATALTLDVTDPESVTKTLRGELVEHPVRVTEIQPGMVETEFSLVRFDGDAGKAAAVYEGVDPLTADDIADCVTWAVTRPAHVNVDEMMVTAQAQVFGFGQRVVRKGV